MREIPSWLMFTMLDIVLAPHSLYAHLGGNRRWSWYI